MTRHCLIITTLAATLAGAGCGEPVEPGPAPVGLAVDSTRPAGNAIDVPFVGPAFIYFDRELDGASVSGATAGILLPGGQATPGRVSYDPQRRAVRLDLALIPGVAYQGVATTAVRGIGGEQLPADYVWSFRTKTPGNGAIDGGGARGGSPVVAFDAGGTTHVAHVDGAAGGVHYAACSADCLTGTNWTGVNVGNGTDTDSRIDMVVSPTGGVAIAWYEAADGALLVSVCDGGCTAASAWQTAVVDDAAGDVGFSPALARGDDGSLHVLAQDRGATAVRYATCAAGCSEAGSWTPAVALSGTATEGRVSDLVVAATGTIHAAWVDDDAGLAVYASCLADCATGNGWSVAPLSATIDAVHRLSLTLDPAGRPVLLFGVDDLVAVGLCVSVSCGGDLGWAFLLLLLDASTGSGFSIAADADGRLHGVYASEAGTVRYVTCSSFCETAAGRWVAGSLTGSVDAVDAAVAIAPGGDPVAVYRRTGLGLAVAR